MGTRSGMAGRGTGRARGKGKVRAPLDRSRILDASHVVIARDGLPAFSMRSLGKELGVEAMSIYHHFPSKAHLLDALLDALLEPLVEQLVDSIRRVTAASDWRDTTRQAAISFRRAVLARPAFATFVLTHRMNTPAGLRYIEGLVAAVRAGGFEGEALARTFRTFGYYLMGALLDEAAGYSRGPSAAEPLTLEQQREIAPTLVGIGRWFADAEHEATFLYGLDVLLDALDRHKPTSTSTLTRDRR
jgi:AcrR family transcriptional regulator